ncbi:putative MFS monocarboxylate transporter [Aspergillus brunneoviolaceus CBS 621.78]|uniref:MFS monocarboxylate transporter n=1 Tax=Aspergillus brunneoviolaceus CBS 621.78 TaxID=1450534 RepID=A0ACD1G9K4_9EURO|nr:MFS monocarboxylate transporter [Aspergillus brunneoviolaceus CBS 621.78]RAH45796.1 MFS monocarboxylate transporter [Aspergillus brunneoviolaceus CBS 621.78]
MGSSDQPSKPQSEYTPRACLMLLGSFTGVFCTVGFVNSFGLFEEYYSKAQLADESQSTIAWIGALAVFFIFSVSLVSGPLLDTIGPRILLCTGSFGTVFSLMMTSLCKELYQFILAQGILLGISQSLLTCPMIALVGQHIKVNRGAAVGIVISGSSLGGVVWPIAVNNLLQNPRIGFGWTMRIVAFIMTPLLTVSCLCCRPPAHPPLPTATTTLQTQSLTPLDAEKSSSPIIPQEQHSQKPSSHETPSILKNPTMHLTCLAFFMIYFGMFSPFFYTTSYAVAEGFSADLAFYTISIINGASLLGRILPGILADRYGRFNCCFVATFTSGIVALCWTKVTSVAGLVIFSTAYGFSSGAILSLQQACALQLATPKSVGLAVGVVMAAASLSAMAGIPISGELAQKYGYLSLSIYSGVSLLVGSLLLLVARVMQSRAFFAVV